MEPQLREFLKAQASTGTIGLEFQGDVATLTLQRAEKRNAMSASMMLELERCVEELEAWPGAVLILRGAGSHFCAGADLALVQGPLSSKKGGKAMCEWMTALLNRIYNAPFISVSVVEGAAMGGGAELATATDFRLLCENARFQFVQAQRGLSPGWGGAARLVQIVGRTRALRLLAGAQAVSFSDALQWGLVDTVFPEGGSRVALSAFLEPILEHQSTAVRANKAALVAALREGVPSVGEAAAFESVWPPLDASTS
jgi:ethylmalonyl-CoA/methylmalonyl-CoA decarboxylase